MVYTRSKNTAAKKINQNQTLMFRKSAKIQGRDPYYSFIATHETNPGPALKENE